MRRDQARAADLYDQIRNRANELYKYTSGNAPLEPFLEMVWNLSGQETYRGSNEFDCVRVYEILANKMEAKLQTIGQIRGKGHTPRVTMHELRLLLTQSKYEAFRMPAKT